MSEAARRTGALEAALPADWNPDRDVLVWVGARTLELLPRRAQGARTFVVTGGQPVQREVRARLVEGPEELYSAVLEMMGSTPTRARVHSEDGIAPADANEAAEHLKQGLQARHVMGNTLEAGGLLWVKNGLANMPAIARNGSLLPLGNAYRGQPAICIAPGPSLSRNVDQLRDLSRRALLIAGTHALHALHAAGVTPHVVVGTDPGDLARHWRGLDLSGVEAFVLAGTCAPETMAVPARRVITFPGNGPADAWLYAPLGNEVRLLSGGSVSCVQLSLALWLGCDRVALVGLDLSFGEHFYAAGGLDADARIETTTAGEFRLVKEGHVEGPGRFLEDGRTAFTVPRKLQELPGWGGGTVRTSPQLAVYHAWFEASAARLSRSARVVNATEGGAHIAGLEHLPLLEATSDWTAEVDVVGPLEQAAATHDAGDRTRRLLEASRNQLRALEACGREVRTCLDLARRARRDEGRLPALARAEKKLTRALRDVPMVNLLSQQEILSARAAAETARTLEENLQASERLYGVVREALAEMLAPLRAACAGLASDQAA
jgi:hypothetical protein